MMKYNPTHESGFSLVELAIVLLISGMMLGGAMTMIKPYVEMSQRNTTMMKQENIAKAFANYAMQYGRLPCPADPTLTTTDYGSPKNIADANYPYTDCGVATVFTNYIGIVPFRALGLTEDNVKDSYGNLMSYSVSPVLAGYDPNGFAPGDDAPATTPGKFSKIHAACRINDRWVEAGKNKNENKALLCCMRYYSQSASQLRDVRVYNQRDGVVTDRLVSSARHVTGDVDNDDYNPVGTGVAASLVPDAPLMPFVAYVLISHGKNGDGAYIGRTNNRKPTTVVGGTGAQEYENRDLAELDFTSQPLNRTANNTYFDDIVLWRTNQQLVSEFGNDSCAKP